LLLGLAWWHERRAARVEDVVGEGGSGERAIAATGIALALNRTLATWLPFRVRPLDDPDLAFAPPYGIHDAPTFSDLSAFPSDHAVMFTALATGALLVSRRAGLVLFLHAAVLVLPVRLYLGLHWPSDVLAGAVFGAALTVLFVRTPLRRWIARPFLAWERRHAASFYALFFLLMFEVAELFDSCVAVGYWVLRLAGHSGVL